MCHFYIISNAPKIAARQPPPAGNRKCALAVPLERSLAPDCHSPSYHLLRVNTLQLKDFCSKSE